MSFARHRQQAERAATRIAVLVALAGATLVLGLDALVVLAWWLVAGPDVDVPQGVHAAVLGSGALAVFGGAWLETRRLRDDAVRIARRLGARPVDPDTDPLHRRLLNLLEELAIAARIGVPRAFVLEDEPGIDALTAGTDPNHAVLVVTRGALTRLTRDELQAVLAHEISHVVNGDVRLHTRLVGLNHGLDWVALAGRSMIASALARPARTAGLLRTVPLATAGAALVVLGTPGELAARAIQAGAGRQRDFFADAQAVAFTRGRDGLGGALRKAAGLAETLRREGRTGDPLRHPYRRQVAHLLLSGPEASREAALRERLRRLYGREMTPLDAAELKDAARYEPELPSLGFAVCVANAWDDDAADPALVPPRRAAAGSPDAAWLDTLPLPESSDGDDGTGAAGPAGASTPTPDVVAAALGRLVQATREPAGAAALVVALIERPGGAAPAWGEGWSCAASRHPALRAAVAALPAEALRSVAWPLTELAVARLRPLSLRSCESLCATVRGVLDADGAAALHGWIHAALLRRRLRVAPAGPAGAPSARAGRVDRADARSIRVLFSVVAQGAQVSDAKAERAANAAIRLLELDPIGASTGAPTAESLDRALRGAAALPPLARPVLVRQLASLLPADAAPEVRDALRLLSVAIDAPPPPRPSRPRPRPVPERATLDEDDDALAAIDA